MLIQNNVTIYIFVIEMVKDFLSNKNMSETKYMEFG